jgi:hypothetical protein
LCFQEARKSQSAIAAHQVIAPNFAGLAVTDWNESMAESIRWDE